MKHSKKLLSLLLAVVLVFAFGAGVMAATITVDDSDVNGSEYAAYKLLNATNAADDKTKFAYTLNEKYAYILKEVSGKNTQADIVAYIQALDADGMRTFADAVYSKIGNIGDDYTTKTNVFENVDQGYYLIVETKAGDSQDTISLVMIDTAGLDNVTVVTKEGSPTVEKKVKETNDTEGSVSDWQDAADYDIGDKVPFQITGTVSSKYADYKVYEYTFKDTLSAGLTYNNDAKVSIDGVDVTGQFGIECENSVIIISCSDLKELNGITVNADSKIVVEYTATLNENAVLKNDNKVSLEYTNNPYADGTGENDTNTTPEDIVTVFSYTLNVDKVDKDGNALEGAGFTLSKKVGEKWVIVGTEVTGVTTFTFEGLDAGEYKLEETTVPAGYNKAADIYFKIVATYDTESDTPQLTDLTVTADDADFSASEDTGLIATNVENNSGTELPSTGGMGTTLFYVFGAVLVLGAAVILVVRRRMQAEK